MNDHAKSVAVRVPRPEVLGEALNEAPTFAAEELLARLDRLARDLSSDPAQAIGHVRILYDAGADGAPADAVSIWRRLCESRALSHRRLVRATRRDGLWALRYGALGFFAALATSVVLDQWQPLPRWLNRPFVEGFLIASWVSLWRPFELLLYEWLPYGRMAQAFDRLATASVVMTPSRPDRPDRAGDPG